MRREEGTSKRELKAFKTMRVRSQTVVPNTACVFQGWANERAVEVRECTQRKTCGKSEAVESTDFSKLLHGSKDQCGQTNEEKR